MEFITFLHSAQIREQVEHGADVDVPITLVIALPTFQQASTVLLCATLTLPVVAPLAHAQDVPEIAILQELLSSRGFDPGAVDGIKGEATTAAILQAQSFYGLEQDGVVGAKTLAALQSDDYRAPGSDEPSEDPSAKLIVDSAIEVSTLQSLLKDRGFYEGEIDGIAGALTQAAILRAQASYGLDQDGIVGSLTLQALNSDHNVDTTDTSANTSVSTQGSDVAELQELLASRGFYRSAIDGIFGPETEGAILRAQAFYELEQDGIAGSQTLGALEADTFNVAASG
ncbi:MAG: peptidoglycan-binding protein [Oscillatoriales cyanobacterium SM2_2_1]|nr:peptidoglycan-binding protein [Oscillatoriales cyanobacterium SM2_2_1]